MIQNNDKLLNVRFYFVLISYIDDPSRFQIHQARAEEITLKEDFISVPMQLDDDFGKILKI